MIFWRIQTIKNKEKKKPDNNVKNNLIDIGVMQWPKEPR